jgi:prepilin peptidase CpaA
MALLPLTLLFALLAAAVWHDVRARRIPNALVFPGALAALVLHAVSGTGVGQALGGLALGLAFLLPMYALRLMGAGDVKLLAMVGAFVGAAHIFTIGLVTLAAGGVLALAYAAWQGKLRQLTRNAYQMMIMTSMSAAGGKLAVAQPAAASGRLPYAVAIAAATAPCALWLHLFGTLPL